MPANAKRSPGIDLGSAILLSGAVAAAATQGVCGAHVIATTRAPWISLLAFWSAAGLTLTALLPLAIVGAGLSRTRQLRAFAQSVHSALGDGDGDEQKRALASIAATAAIAYAVPLAARCTRWLFGRSGANVAATGGVLLTLALVSSACLLGAVVGSALATRIARAPRLCHHLERALAHGLQPLAIALLVIAMANALAPDEYALTLDVAIAVSGSMFVPRIRGIASRFVKRPRIAVAAAIACGGGAPLATMALPNEAQLAVLHHAPIAATMMGTFQAAYARVAPPPADVRVSTLRAPQEAPPNAPRTSGAASTGALRPDIVLVHLDTVRPDHVGFAGYPRATTPSLDRFRADATWFEKAYTTQPSTLVAIGSVFTGIQAAALPNRRGPGPDLTLLPTSTTIPERLESLGYDSIGLTMPYVFEHMHGVDRGFRVWQPSYPAADAENHREAGLRSTTDRALAFLADRERSGRPTFLFVHYECAHGPYLRHPSFDFGESLTDRYDGAIAYCDAELGRLLSALALEKDRTAVIVYSDHGELLGEHGYSAHGATLLEKDVRVLLLARLPNASVATVSTPVSLADLAPTVLALAGDPVPTIAPAMGRAWNLLPFAEGTETERADRPIFFHRVGQRGPYRLEAHGVVVADTKYVRTDPDIEELYRLDLDPEEHQNLLSSRFGDPPDDIRALRDPLATLIGERRTRQAGGMD